MSLTVFAHSPTKFLSQESNRVKRGNSGYNLSIEFLRRDSRKLED